MKNNNLNLNNSSNRNKQKLISNNNVINSKNQYNTTNTSKETTLNNKSTFNQNLNLKEQKEIKTLSNVTNYEESHERDEKYAQEKIIAKIIKKGFESLSLEELAVTLISPSFEEEYYQKTNQEWSKENKAKAKDRLNNAKFNIEWNTQVSKPLQVPFGILFELVEKGDIQRVTEYLRKNAQYQQELLLSVDKNKRSPLHIAAKNGNTIMTGMLLSRGYSIHMRDKFLRTPLHTACQYGRPTVADVLIKSKSDITARDSVGRTCLHLAVCANSVELISLLLGIEPELVHSRDSYGRTPLHYVVWNLNPNGLEIVRLLIKTKAEIDAMDEENMTPLHYAADGGKGWIIPLLLRNGANPFIRDGRTNRTALELALTEHIREMIIVYSGKPYVVKDEDKEIMKLNGEKIDLDGIKNEEYELRRGRQKSQPKKRNIIKEIADDKKTDESEDKRNINSFLFKTQKEKLMNFLKRIQEYGIKSMQHLTKPYLYSGSWIENVNNIEEFFKNLCSSSQAEAVMKVYNILSPYSEIIPPGDGDESDMANFFNINKNTEKNGEVENLLNILDPKNEINSLKEKIKILEEKIFEFQNNKNNLENSDLISELQNQIRNHEINNEMLKTNSERLTETIHQLTDNINNYKRLFDESKKSETAAKQELKKLSDKLKEIEEENFRLREKEKKNILQNLNQIELKKFSTVLTFKENLQNEYEILSLTEEKSIYIFLKKVENNYLNLMNILTQFDKDNDLHIFKNEMINLLEELKIPIEDRPPILKLAGFTSIKNKMPIKNLSEKFYKRAENKNKIVNEILFKIAYILHNNYINTEQVYEFMKLNDERKLNISELKQGLKSLEINLSDVDVEILFRGLLESDSNKIDLNDLIEKLKIRKIIIDEIGDINNKIRFNNVKTISDKNVEIEDKARNSNENNILMQEESEDIYDNKYNENNLNCNGPNNKKYDDINFNKNLIDDNMKYEDYINSQNEHERRDESLNKDFSNNSKNEQDLNSKQLSENIPHQNNSFDNNKQFNNQAIATLNNKKREVIKKDSNNPMDIFEVKQANDSKKNNNNYKNNQYIKSNTNKSNQINGSKQINGELKIQVKNVENIVLPSSLSKPYAFIITGSLKGLDMEFQSKEIFSDDSKSTKFNWATRIMIRNQTLTELGSLLKLELKVINKKIPIAIGECLLNWTQTLQEINLDKFVIDDRFQLLSKRMMTSGLIHVQLKFIPFGSVNSYYDKDGKKNAFPNTLRGLIETNTVHTLDNRDNKNHIIKDEGKLDKDKNNVELKERILIKSIEAEIINVIDKSIFVKKEDLYLTISDPIDNSELFSSKDSQPNFAESIRALPFNFNFFCYVNESESSIGFIMSLKEKSPISNQEDIIIAKTKIEFINSKEKYFTISDKYNLQILKKNYFNKSIRKNEKENDLIFFIKFTVEDGRGEENLNDDTLKEKDEDIDQNGEDSLALNNENNQQYDDYIKEELEDLNNNIDIENELINYQDENNDEY